MTADEVLLTIDLRLRFVLFGLECALNVEFSPSEAERIFADALTEPVAGKQYTLWQGSDVSVTGWVDEYEPETVFLRVQSRRPIKPPLPQIAGRAEYQVYRWQHRLRAEADADETNKIGGFPSGDGVG